MSNETAEGRYTLRLYVSSRVDSAHRAAADVRRICNQAFTESACTLDIIDVREHPDLAEADKILATPTLIRKAPPPQRRLIGDFSDSDAVLSALGVDRVLAGDVGESHG